MPGVKKIFEIKAPPDDVFKIIRRIEDFPEYTNLIKEVKEIETGIFRWVVKIGRMELKWDSTITELVDGKRIAWASIKGIKNSGYFDLEPTKGGTCVTFNMEYHFPFTAMDDVIGYISSYWLETVSTEIISKVKRALEG